MAEAALAPDGVDTLFHPAVAGWLRARFGAPTPVQARAWAVTARRQHALIAAPTGSGKTLAAFLAAIDALVKAGLDAPLPDAVQVLYVSPLKALSNDIRKNLDEPLAGIRAALAARGLPDPGIRAAVRTGDTPAAERARMRRQPPHILVTTPESLYILLTTESGRAMLGSVQTVIVDELHAVAGVKRGAHLMLTLERLQALCATPPVRVGLSATVKPLADMARFLGGARPDPVAVIDTGHVRARDLALVMPHSPLAAVMAGEVWEEVYDIVANLVAAHRTTLVFVNQRRTAERAARQLALRLGDEHVAAHHGSLAREHRLQAEERLKAGALKVLVATSSLELGIDIGDVDLVCQLGSPRSINAFLQRVGRSGHAVGALPKGRLFPLSLDDLLECSALLDAVARGELDAIHPPEEPLDVLAQQLVAEVACREWRLDELYALVRRAQPYAALPRERFDAVLQMLAEGYGTRRGRRGAYLHLDAVNGVVRARRGAQLSAVSNAGVIPDQFDVEVVLQPEGHRVGTLNEDFAFESLAGDVFQLGNTAYRILKVETGKVMVEDAKGQPPSMPFWLGGSLSRTDALSHAVARLLARADAWLADTPGGCALALQAELHLPEPAARQLSDYLAASRAALGVLPSDGCVVFERFFDEVGDTHLVIHAPFGSRVNKAWGLALRKRFCRQFNFELQASALEDSIVLSLGPTHSFALDEVARYLRSGTARNVLVQALLAAPMFGTRWRWNATAALAQRRMVGGRKVPPQFQRSDAEDLLTLVFPDQVACAENLVGEREVPDHPLVLQTLRDCLQDTMDADGFIGVLQRLEAGTLRVVARDLAAPSPLSYAVLNARPFAFLDDGEAEARRTKAVRTGGALDVARAADLGRLDPAAITQVRDEAWPALDTPDELHDALLVHGFLTEAEVAHGEALGHADALAAQGRLGWCVPGAGDAAQGDGGHAGGAVSTADDGRGERIAVAAERWHEFLARWPGARTEPPLRATSAARPDAADALRHLVCNRLELLGPVTAAALGAPLGLADAAVRPALLRLESEGAVMHGGFTDPAADEWCDRRLLARIHRLTRDRRRAESRPVAPAQFMRFLFRWHGLPSADATHDERPEGEEALLAVLRQLEGVAVPVAAWEPELLAARLRHYEPAWLDKLCATGRVAWWRPAVPPGAEGRPRSGPVRATPVLLAERAALAHWQQAWAGEAPVAAPSAHPRRDAGATASGEEPPSPDAETALTGRARLVMQALRDHGASFFADLQHDTRLLGTELEGALGELVAAGLVTCDSFAGLRALVMPADKRRRLQRRAPPGRDPALDDAGRWALARRPQPAAAPAGALADPHVEHIVRVLLRRWGVVFRRLVEREDGLPPWRELLYVLRRLEAREEVRGGRFVSGFSGEQFALPEAAAALRRVAREAEEDAQHGVAASEHVAVSAVDPLNLAGLITPGERVPRLPGNRLLYDRGVPVAVQVGGELRYLTPLDAPAQWALKHLLIRRQRPGSLLPPPAQAQ